MAVKKKTRKLPDLVIYMNELLQFIELIKCNRDSVRKVREAYLIERGKTLEPLGMNKKDEM